MSTTLPKIDTQRGSDLSRQVSDNQRSPPSPSKNKSRLSRLSRSNSPDLKKKKDGLTILEKKPTREQQYMQSLISGTGGNPMGVNLKASVNY